MGLATTDTVSVVFGSTSESLAKTPGATGESVPFSAIVYASATAVGAWGIAVTESVTVVVALTADPSNARYEKESLPIYKGVGTYTNDPSALSESSPWAGDATSCAESVVPASMSESFRSTPVATGTVSVPSSAIAYDSMAAVGAWLTGKTVSATVTGALTRPPSLTV